MSAKVGHHTSLVNLTIFAVKILCNMRIAQKTNEKYTYVIHHTSYLSRVDRWVKKTKGESL